MKPTADLAKERKQERERVKRILDLAPPGQFDDALRLALDTDLPPEQCATRLLAGVRTTSKQANSNGHHARPGLWASALAEAARRRLARK